MSTLKVSEIRNASSATGGLSIAADGVVSGALPYPNRNLLYNGAMQVAQRGTSTAGLGNGDSGYHTADRWYMVAVGSPTFAFTQSIEADAPAGFSKSLKFLATTGQGTLITSDSLRVEQRLEGQDLQRLAKGTASAQQLTLSFWVKSNVTGTYVVSLLDNDNTRYVAATYSISASATWQQVSVTFPADTTGSLDSDSGYSLAAQFWLAAGPDRATGTLPTTWEAYNASESAVGQTNLAAATNNYWQITGVQLEVGDTATEFEHLPFGVELAKCQRYWEQSYAPGTAGGTNTEAGIVQSMNGLDGNQIAGIRWLVTKRAAPTVSIWSKAGTASTVSNTSLNDSGANNGSWSTIAGNSVHGFRALVGTGGLTAAAAYNFHYTANAEL